MSDAAFGFNLLLMDSALSCEHEHEQIHVSLIAQVSAAISTTTAFFSSNDDLNLRGRVPGSTNIKREHQSMTDYINNMDERLFRCKYRMSKPSFFSLFDIIEDHLPSTGEKRNKPGGVPNGVITKEARLSMAIRYFYGGDPLDIADIHGVSTDEVRNSIWDVVDAIHLYTELRITFPHTWEEQTEVMMGFKSKSLAAGTDVFFVFTFPVGLRQRYSSYITCFFTMRRFV